MTPTPFAARLSQRALDPAEVARCMTEGGDERIALDPRTGRNAYGCAGAPWTGGATFGSTTASPLTPAGLKAAGALLESLGETRPDAGHQAVRDRLAVLCGLTAGREADIILAPSGTDLHAIAAGFARAEGRGALVTVTPDPAESGRGVQRAVCGLSYAASPPFAHRARAEATLPPGQLIAVPLRAEDAAARPAAEVEADIEAACERAVRSGGAVLLILLDVSKTGLAAPDADCAARLKARHGERLTVLVDACQFRLSPAAVREHLARDFLVAVSGSKFLGGPPFCGALLVPPASAGRLRRAPLPWRALECSAREDWPDAYPGRSLLPRAFSLGPVLRWAPALENLAALASLPAAASDGFVDGFGGALAARLAQAPAAFELIAQPRDASRTIFPILLKRGGRPLDAEAVAAVYARLRDLAYQRNAGHLWIGQPVTVGYSDGRPLSAVRIALGASHLIDAAQAPDGCDRLLSQADECLREIARLVGG
jgi:hypothetical protein